MLFGVCTNMLPRDPGSVGEQYLPILAELGYDYVELPLGDLVTVLTAAQRRSLQKRVSDTLLVRAANNFFPAGIRVCGPEPTPFAEIMDYCSRALDIAAALGAKFAVLGSPWAKQCPECWPKEAAFDQLVTLSVALGEAAEKAGITVAIEPNNTSETNMINTYADALRLIRAVGHPGIRGLVDYYHLRYENEPLSDLSDGGSYLVHTHFARFDGRGFPKEVSEDALYAPYFGTLRSIGYTGGVSLEGFPGPGADLRKEAAAALCCLREMV